MTDEFYMSKQVYYIKSTRESNDWGSIVRMGSQRKFLNNKAKLSCYIKTEDIDNKAVLFISINEVGESVFENIEIYGNKDWKKYELIVQYPGYTYTKYGIALYGNGRVLFSDMLLEPEGEYEIPQEFEM